MCLDYKRGEQNAAASPAADQSMQTFLLLFHRLDSHVGQSSRTQQQVVYYLTVDTSNRCPWALAIVDVGLLLSSGLPPCLFRIYMDTRLQSSKSRNSLDLSRGLHAELLAVNSSKSHVPRSTTAPAMLTLEHRLAAAGTSSSLRAYSSCLVRRV
ncbi:hypothetical protein BD309DRAFT_515748 [Dichomitus squalens]|nr:hypothetical protein BD309DRAFT_515748 [Dichomitus squalens]